MKPKSNYAVTEKTSAMDRCQTPPYALEPLLHYLIPGDLVWEPAKGEGILANALRVFGMEVHATDLLTGQDFFTTNSPGFHKIITNPPYGGNMKKRWLEYCCKLDVPFALLMPTEFIGTGDFAELCFEYEIKVLQLYPRIDFKMPNEKWASSAQFPTAWYTRGIIEGNENLLFDHVNKPKKAWTGDYKTNKKGKVEKVMAYPDWIEHPTSYNHDFERFTYE